jgi:hypothetical protein
MWEVIVIFSKTCGDDLDLVELEAIRYAISEGCAIRICFDYSADESHVNIVILDKKKYSKEIKNVEGN